MELNRRLPVVALAIIATACSPKKEPPASNGLSATAQAFFHAIYGCAPEHLDEISNPDVAHSYPIFETLYDTSVIRGLSAVTEFSASFCRRWADPSISIHQVINDGDRVVLVWSFSGTDQQLQDSLQSHQSWGGISVFEFDESGRVLQEFGEESTPGPAARLEGTRAYEALHVAALFKQGCPRMLDAAGVARGGQVLDVACGTGVLAREAAVRVGPAGSVAGVDPGHGMLAVAKELAPAIEWQEGAAESLPHPCRSFDAVVSQFCLMFFSDRGGGGHCEICHCRRKGRLQLARAHRYGRGCAV